MTINNNIYNAMKKKVLFAVCSLLMCFGHAWADELTIGNVTIPQGGTADLMVNYSFTSTTDKVGFTFSIALPEGISFVKDEDGDPVYLKDAMSIDKLNIVCAGEGNFAGQPANATATIKGTVGTLLTLTLKADASLAVGSDYDVNVTKVTFQEQVDGSVKDINLNDFTFKVTIGEPVDTRTILDENSTVEPVAETNANIRVRRIINAGEWSTICLPFAMTAEQVKASFGEDVELADFNGINTTYADDETTVTGIKVKFNTVSAIEANHPYIIKVSEAISEFTVDNVDIVVEEMPSVDKDEYRTGSGTKKDPYVYLYNSFVGSYLNQTVVPDLCLFLSDNKFWYSVGTTEMKGFRAYFDFYDVLSEVEGAESRIMIIRDEDEALNINASLKLEIPKPQKIFNLNGQLVTTPRKGVYIMNGKKIVVK